MNSLPNPASLEPAGIEIQTLRGPYIALGEIKTSAVRTVPSALTTTFVKTMFGSKSYKELPN